MKEVFRNTLVGLETCNAILTYCDVSVFEMSPSGSLSRGDWDVDDVAIGIGMVQLGGVGDADDAAGCAG